MKKIIIIFGILLMIVGASVGILKWLNIGPFKESNISAESKSGDATKRIKEKAKLLELEPLTIHLVQDDKVVSIIKIELKLKTRGNDNFDLISGLKPKLTHAFLSDLHSFLPRMISKLNRIDQSVIRERLVMLSQKVTRKKIVEDVLIKSITDKAPKK